VRHVGWHKDKILRLVLADVIRDEAPASACEESTAMSLEIENLPEAIRSVKARLDSTVLSAAAPKRI
jgi:hypothetical protein